MNVGQSWTLTDRARQTHITLTPNMFKIEWLSSSCAHIYFECMEGGAEVDCLKMENVPIFKYYMAVLWQ